MVLKVGILIFDNVELLDFAGPLEVFYVARQSETIKDTPLFEVFTVASEAKPIQVEGGLKVLPDKTFEDVDELDILVIPGGHGARMKTTDSPEVKFIKELQDKTETVATVCTGAFLYAISGDRSGEKLVTHHNYVAMFREKFPQIEFVENCRYYDDDLVVSAGGITCGIDLALYLVYKHFGEEAVDYTSSVLEYLFTP